MNAWAARYLSFYASTAMAAQCAGLALPINAPVEPYVLQALERGWTGHWLITDRGDREAWALADRHYTRQTPGARSFVRNGQNLVFVTRCGKAAWVSFRPTPGKAERWDDREAIECALFRNESTILSSDLIREARALTVAIWGWPKDGIITWVKPSALRAGNVNPGACYKRDKWKHTETSKDGKPMLVAPETLALDWRLWEFKQGRGGKLRKELTGWDGKSKRV
jgi:hypothetical protein